MCSDCLVCALPIVYELTDAPICKLFQTEIRIAFKIRSRPSSSTATRYRVYVNYQCIAQDTP